MSVLLTIACVIGGLLALLVFLHLMMFIVRLFLLPFTLMISFMEMFISPNAPSAPVFPQCPFMKWWRKHV